MNFFKFDLRRALTLIVLLSLPLISINLQQRSGKDPWIFKPFTIVSGSSQSIYSSFSSAVRETTDLYINLIGTKRKNKELAASLIQAELNIQQMDELKIENERLLKLLNFKSKTPMDLVPARIIGRDLLSEYQSLVIDKGENQGIKKNMAVINAAGAIGYVYHASKNQSFVLLLADRYAVLDVIVQRSRARGILGGQGEIDYELKYLKRTDDVQVGDRVITSGLDNIFPKGVPVGVIKSVEKSEFGFEQIVQVSPAINPDELEELFVITNTKNFDAEELAETKQPDKDDNNKTSEDVKK